VPHSFAIKPFGYAIVAKRIHGALFKYTCPDTGAHMVPAPALDNDGVDPVLLQNPSKE
jgi:hypothetical protein